MDASLYLTAEEKTLFDALPATLKDQWNHAVKTEDMTSYETKEQIAERMKRGYLAKFPAAEKSLEAVVKQINEGKSIESISLKDFPEDAVPALLYSIGATGCTALMQLTLRNSRLTTEDMQGVAVMSRARHRILQMNLVLVS